MVFTDMTIWDLLFQIVFRMWVLQNMVHEYGHLLALRLMGYDGIIRQSALNRVVPLDYASMTALELKFFYFSGGFFQAVIFLLMCWHNDDEENILVNKMVAIQGIFYAFCEALAPRAWWGVAGTFGLIISVLFMTLVLTKKYNLALSQTVTS